MAFSTSRGSVAVALLFILLVLGVLFNGYPAAIPMPAPSLSPMKSLASSEPMLQGMGPTTIAATEDGKYAYIGFHLSDVVFKVLLANLTIEAVADLSDYFPLQCYHIMLDASGEKLFVHSASWRRLLVLDTQTMSVVHTIDNIGAQDIIRSRYGPFLVAWDGGNTVRFINTETYEVTELTDNRIGFIQIEESRSDQDKWYVATQEGDRWVVGIYDHKAGAWVRKITVLPQGEISGINDLMILPNERKLYAAVWGGYYPETQTHGYGWLFSVDLTGWQVNFIPIDGGEFSLETTPNSQWVYVGANWPKPANANNIQIVDTQTDMVTGSIDLSGLSRPQFTEVRDLQIDPANPRFLYAVSNDANAFIKVDLDNLTLADVLFFNKENLQPSFFVKGPKHTTGYILIPKSAEAFELDLDEATIRNVVTFPAIRADAATYDVAVDDAGDLLIAQGEYMLEVDPEDMRLLGTHPLPSSIGGLWHFVLSADRTKMYSVWQDPASGQEYPDVFLALDATTFEVKARIKLEGGVFNERPFELPDRSKLYVLGGWDWGSIVVQVIGTDNYTVQKTITYDPAGDLGISAGPYFPFAYDSNSHTLFVGAGTVVLAIDTDTDVIEKVIDLGDLAGAIGLEPEQFIYVNAIGLIYQPQENYLYIAHLDRAFVSIYDLNNDQFLQKVIPLKGFFPCCVFADDNCSRIYTLNTRSDSVSVIDVGSKVVEKVIDLAESATVPDSSWAEIDWYQRIWPYLVLVVIVAGIVTVLLRSKRQSVASKVSKRQ
jgi:YVTN family beta-propeller protein